MFRFDPNELQKKKDVLARNNQGIKVRSQDGSVCIEKLVDGQLVKIAAQSEPVPAFIDDANKGRNELFPKKFDAENHRWIRHNQQISEALTLEEYSTLSMVTFNVWFDSYYQHERAQALFELVQDLNPNFICIQECTQTFIDMLLEQRWVKERYYISDSVGNTISPYGVLMLSTLPVHSFYLYNLPTSQGRKILAAEVLMKQKKESQEIKRLVVTTAHLESGFTEKDINRRMAQLGILFDYLNARTEEDHHTFVISDVFHMGDCNFGRLKQSFPEIGLIPPEVNDLWPTLHPNDPGMTYPKYNDRYDRILFRSQHYQPKEVTIIGDEPLLFDENDDSPVFPSDHFGLYGVFTTK